MFMTIYYEQQCWDNCNADILNVLDTKTLSTVFIDFLNAYKMELDPNHFTTKLNQLEEGNVKQLLQHLFDELENKGKRISFLEQKVVDLEDRIHEQERYSSKDTLIFENAPICNDKNYPLAEQMCDFLKDYLNFETCPGNFKACHPLGPWKSGKFAPAIIIKFIYFGEKSEIYKRKSWLSKCVNPTNKSPIYIKERLPKTDVAIKQHAESLNLITTTLNSQVKVFRKNCQGVIHSVGVNSLKAVDDIKNTALQKRKAVQPIAAPTKKYPTTSSRKPNLEEILKSIREAPDEEGVQFLKEITDSAYLGNIGSLINVSKVAKT